MAMQDFIKNYGREPIKPDACKGKAYSSQSLGALGEQYIACMLKQLHAIKRGETTDTSPDFEITVNGKKFLLETKVLSNLYRTPLTILREAVNESICSKETREKISHILENCDFSIDPINIHRQDEQEFMEKLIIFHKKLKLPRPKASTMIRCSKTAYALSLSPKRIKIKGISSLFSGVESDVTKSIANVIYKKHYQIAKSDILVFVLLNKWIVRSDLVQLFYAPINMCLQLPGEGQQSSQQLIVTQLDYNSSIWGRKFTDKQGSSYSIGDQLKCIFAVYPYAKEILVFPSPRAFDDFQVDKYYVIREVLISSKFNCLFASMDIRLEKG